VPKLRAGKHMQLLTSVPMQVEAVKGGLAPEVEKLALALQRKSGRVGQLQERLLSRLRWGVARLQASHAAGVLRHALAGWRCVY